MKTVTRIFTSNLSQRAPVIEEGITLDQLLRENEGYEDFAYIVWNTCTDEGMYDDSDQSSDLLCIYVKGN